MTSAQHPKRPIYLSSRGPRPSAAKERPEGSAFSFRRRLNSEPKGSFWSIKSTLSNTRDEYRGWRKFRRATGIWPMWSIIATATSTPLLFAVGLYAFIQSLETSRLWLIDSTLIVVGFGFGLLWYAVRRWANHADLVRAQRNSTRNI